MKHPNEPTLTKLYEEARNPRLSGAQCHALLAQIARRSRGAVPVRFVLPAKHGAPDFAIRAIEPNRKSILDAANNRQYAECWIGPTRYAIGSHQLISALGVLNWIN